jgi:hypothetical protein
MGSHYPTQAKVRLEWATHHLLAGEVIESLASQAIHRIDF